MTVFDPVLPGWLLVLLGVMLGGLCVWRIIAMRRDHRAAWMWVARLGMLALLLVIATRPTIVGDGQGPSASGGLEVYFVVDTTSSMAAEDWEAGDDGEPLTRLDGVKNDIDRIADLLAGAEFSLVTFDVVAVQRVPLTSDDSALRSAVSVMRQEVTRYSRGSSIDEPIDLLAGLLTAAAADEPDQRRVVFYFGDGEQTADIGPRSFTSLADLIDGGAVLGYGTAEGGRMLEFNGIDAPQWGQPTPTPDPFAEPEIPVYIQDYSTGADGISVIDETALGIIAQDLGVDYLYRTPDTTVDAATDGIDVGELVTDEGEPDTAVELYWIFAIPLGVLALLEILAMGGAVVEAFGVRRRTP